eukprot:1839649-Rhodomonas_salina.1
MSSAALPPPQVHGCLLPPTSFRVVLGVWVLCPPFLLHSVSPCNVNSCAGVAWGPCMFVEPFFKLIVFQLLLCLVLGCGFPSGCPAWC